MATTDQVRFSAGLARAMNTDTNWTVDKNGQILYVLARKVAGGWCSIAT